MIIHLEEIANAPLPTVSDDLICHMISCTIVMVVYYSIFPCSVISYSITYSIHCVLTFTDGDYYNGSISVLNTCRLNTPNGKIDSITGHAYRPDEKEQGKLKVVFDDYGNAQDCKYTFPQ